MVGLYSHSVEQARAEVEIVAATTDTFGIGLVACRLDHHPDLVDLVTELRPRFVSVSFGDYAIHLPRLHDADIVVATQVGTVEEAEAAAAAGIDLIVARGGEAGGHGRDRVATLPLLEAVLDRVDVPVLAAGGIATSRGLAAVIAAGAAGAWIGTAFLGCPETSWTATKRARVIDAGLGDTVYTEAFDTALGHVWPTGIGGRALRNKFSDRWQERVEELAGDTAVRERQHLLDAARREDFDEFVIYAGQAAGLVHEERTVAAVVAELAGAEALLRKW